MTSRKRLYATLSGIAALACIGVGYWYFGEQASFDAGHAESADAPHVADSSLLNEPISQSTSFPPRRPQTAWTAVAIDNSDPASKWAHVPEHATFVRLNDRFDEWLLNTPIEIHIPDGDHTFHAIVEQITPNSPTSTTIRASPAPEEHQLGRFILTFGIDHTLAYVTSKHGRWELVGDGEIGWLVSTSDLKRSQDYGESDVLIERRDRYANAEYVPRRSE